MPTCPVCNKAVYAAEEKKSSGKSYHALCFRCSQCGKGLEQGKEKDHGGAIYCESCHGKKFGPALIGAGRGNDTGGLGTAQGVAKPASPRPSASGTARTPSPRPPAANRPASPRPAGRSASPRPANVAGRSASPRPGGRSASPRPAAAVGGAPKCAACGKSVYAAEEVKALNKVFHNTCFCCQSCKKTLRGGEYKDNGDMPFCQACYAKEYGPKGIGAGRSNDTGGNNNAKPR